MLPSEGPCGPSARIRCDPHRPWRAGAARPPGPAMTMTPEVAILTGRGGPVLPGRGVVTKTHPAPVAILTGRGGPVLLLRRDPRAGGRLMLRSSPAVEGRCCLADSLDPVDDDQLRSSPAVEGRCCGQPVWRLPSPIRGLRSSPAVEGRCCWSQPYAVGVGYLALRSSPAVEGRCCEPSRAPTSPPRCCDPHRPWRAGAAVVGHRGGRPRPQVAILTGRGGPVLRPDVPRRMATPDRCDPHRPWRAGAAPTRPEGGHDRVGLRSSPAVEGRCCFRPRASSRHNHHQVAILTGRGGPVLRSAIRDYH